MSTPKATIDKSVPIPAPGAGLPRPSFKHAQARWPFALLELGESFLVPQTAGCASARAGRDAKAADRAAAQAWSAARAFVFHHPDFSFVAKVEPQGLRIWRLGTRGTTRVHSSTRLPALIEIEKGVPLPPVKTRRGCASPSVRKYPFPQMEIGDSFLVVGSKGARRRRNGGGKAKWDKDEPSRRAANALIAAQAYRGHHPDFRYASRMTTEGLRIWRVGSNTHRKDQSK